MSKEHKSQKIISIQSKSQRQAIQQLTRQTIGALGVAAEVSVWMIGSPFSFGRAS